MAVYLYRVQNEEGEGPYHAYDIDAALWQSGRHSSPDRPAPYYDPELEYRAHIQVRWKFGFQTLRLLQAWFRPEELRKLEKLGFHPVRVRAVKMCHSACQSVYLEG